MTNPLQEYFRAPKLYTKLPSKGKFYDAGSVELALNGEVAVYAMTALDQINIKTPDALLNGEALLKIISNCVPGIKNAKQLVEPDINTLLLAIRIASQGAHMELPCVCPSCSKENNFQIDLTAILETQTELDDVEAIDLDGELLVYVRPYNFEQRNLTLLNEIQESQAVSLLNQNPDLDPTERMTELGKHVSKMADRTFDIVAKSITGIKIVKSGQLVQEEQFIKEWLKGISSQQASIILDKIKQLNKEGIDTTCNFICENCNHEWKQPIDFDPAGFFG